jgi:competence protein ComGC
MKLNNRGISLIEVMAATVVLSYAILMISNNVTNMIKLNEVTADRVEAFNNAELLANNFTVLENSGLAASLNPVGTEVSTYTLDDCDNGGALESILGEVYCQELFSPDYNITYEEGDIVMYVFESLESNFNHIINGGYSEALTSYAENYTSDYYSTGLTAYTVDNIVIVVYFFEDVYVTFGEVLIYEVQ